MRSLSLGTTFDDYTNVEHLGVCLSSKTTLKQ